MILNAVVIKDNDVAEKGNAYKVFISKFAIVQFSRSFEII